MLKYTLGEKKGNLYKIIYTEEFFNVSNILNRAYAKYENCLKNCNAYIEKESNLSQEGKSVIFENAKVFGNAKVYADAIVYGNAQVFGNAQVYGQSLVYGNAQVYGNAWIYNKSYIHDNGKVYGDAKIQDAQVYGNGQVFDDAWVYSNAQVCGNARVFGNAQVSNNAYVYGNAKVYDSAHVINGAEVYGNAEVCYDAEVDYNANSGKITEKIKSNNTKKEIKFINKGDKFISDKADDIEILDIKKKDKDTEVIYSVSGSKKTNKIADVISMLNRAEYSKKEAIADLEKVKDKIQKLKNLNRYKAKLFSDKLKIEIYGFDGKIIATFTGNEVLKFIDEFRLNFGNTNVDFEDWILYKYWYEFI